jgi:hypothetical protein
MCFPLPPLLLYIKRVSLHRIYMDGHSCFSDSNYWGAGNSLRQDYKQLQDWKGICAVSEQQACK